MSADNAIGVKKIGDYWFVKMIFMSDDEHDLSDGIRCESREAALSWAGSMMDKEVIVEYGIIDLDEQPSVSEVDEVSAGWFVSDEDDWGWDEEAE